MTTRVQKGGPIFKPVVKSRSRLVPGDIRQSSIVPNGSDNSLAAISSALGQPPDGVTPSNVQEVSNPPLQVVNVSTHASSLGSNHQPAIPSLASSGSPRTQGVHRLMLNQPVSVNTRASPSQSTFTLPTAVTQPSPLALDRSGTIDSHVEQLPSQGHDVHNRTFNSPNAGVVIQPPTSITSTSTSMVNNRSVNSHTEVQINSSNLPIQTRRQKDSQEASGEPPKRSKRKRKPATDAEESNEEASNKPKRRASSRTPRPRNSRPPSLPPFDADADPGEEIDPTVVTMASLCDDTGQGRVSRKAVEILTNHAAWKAQNREKRARMKTLMEQKKYGKDETGDVVDTNQDSSNCGAVGSTSSVPSKSPNPATSAALLDDTGGGFDYSQDLATSRFNVQVRIGPNGETIIDEESLIVDRAEGEDMESYTHVVESDNTKFVNSGSYGKRFRGSRWSAEETESFYDALSQYGENYELIAYVLPGRDRKSCKNKFKAEDKKNPARINYCLRNSIPVDMETLSRMTGKDFSGPVPEIRAPTPRPNVEVNNSAVDEERSATRPTPKRNNNKKRVTDDGVVVIGEVGGVED